MVTKALGRWVGARGGLRRAVSVTLVPVLTVFSDKGDVAPLAGSFTNTCPSNMVTPATEVSEESLFFLLTLL